MKSSIEADSQAIRVGSEVLAHLCGGLVTKLCPALCDAMDCSPPHASVRGTVQARILKWVAIAFSRGSS